jgi:hypothetical protein
MQSINLNLDLDLTARRRDPGASSIHCCCGNPECAMLKRNCSVLETVEKDVQTAAQLGQVSLSALYRFLSPIIPIQVPCSVASFVKSSLPTVLWS